MKTIIRTTTIAALILGLTSTPTYADDEALAAFGGFIVGVITGAVIENNSHGHVDAGVEISYETRGHPARYARSRACGKHGRYNCNACSHRHHGPKGHWKTTRYKVWVPGHWTFVVNNCGDRIRVWQRGHYTYQTKRIWVERRYDDHYRSRHG